MNDGPYERHAFIPDLHPPIHDRAAVAVALAFVRQLRPHHLWLLGDDIDFYQLSRFDKDPQRATELQADADCAHELLREFRKAAPQADFTYLAGNHEKRLLKYLWSNAPAIASLRNVTVPALLRLDELKIDYAESGQVRVADLLIKHGNVVRARAGNSANGELDRAGISGVSGHTHRAAGPICRRTLAGSIAWIESGCLCDLQPAYLEGQTADWQHAVSYGYLERGGNRFVTHLLPIVNGRVIFDGREITARPR